MTEEVQSSPEPASTSSWPRGGGTSFGLLVLSVIPFVLVLFFASLIYIHYREKNKAGMILCGVPAVFALVTYISVFTLQYPQTFSVAAPFGALTLIGYFVSAGSFLKPYRKFGLWLLAAPVVGFLIVFGVCLIALSGW